MITIVINAVLLSVISCLQIHCYTPFKGKLQAGLYAVFLAAQSCVISSLPNYIDSRYCLIALWIGAILSCLLGLLLCKTKPRCGIYNVIIQLDVNYLIIFFADKLSMLLGLWAGPVCVALLGVLWLLIMRKLRKIAWVIMPQPEKYYTWPMCFVLLIHLVLSLGQWLSGEAACVLAFSCVFFLVLTLYSIYLPQLIIREQEQTSMIRYQQQAMQGYTSACLMHEETMRAMRHDMKHVLATVEELLEKGESDDAYELTIKARKELQDRSAPSFGDNMLVNAILEDYSQRFASADIKFKPTVRLSQPVLIADLDLTTLLHNILSNALEYGEHNLCHTEGEVRFSIYQAQGFLCIRTSNPLTEKPTVIHKQIRSSKGNSDGAHGIGLASIGLTVEKYNGEHSVSVENGEFVLSLMMENRKMD